MKKIPWRTISWLLVSIFIIMQFFRIDKTNPPVIEGEDFIQIMQPSIEIAEMIKGSCYDCHSHETKYPWYMDIAPVSWWTKGHVDHGREKLNFSKWGTYDGKKANHKLEECFEEVEATHMPLASYLLMHPEARLSDEQRAQLVAYFKEKYESGN